MNMGEKYLSEEELNALIAQIEQSEMVTTTSDFMDEVLKKIGEPKEEKVVVISSNQNRKWEFERYCIRVITSVAAAIVMVFCMPEVETTREMKVPVRQEVIGKNIIREEALDDTGYFEKIWNKVSDELGGLLNETKKEE